MSYPNFVIVIEGADKTGKSTLAASLVKFTGWPVAHMRQPASPGPDVALQECLDALEHQKGPFIADRFHVGESVYGPLYRGTPPMDPAAMKVVEERLLDRGCLLVLMEDDPAAIAARFRALGEDFAREADVRDILERYDAEWRRSRLAKVRARWDGESDHVARLVVGVAEAMGAWR